jgi:hypothetical protein
MAALESTLNAEAEDSVVEPGADDETALATAEEDDAVAPLEAWGETKDEPPKEEKKLHQCVFDTNRKLGLHLKRGDDGRAVVTKVDEEGQAAAGRLKAGYILTTFDDEACDDYDLFLECFAKAKEHEALIKVGFEKVKTPKDNEESELVEAECEVQEAIVERAPPEKRDMLARKIKDRLRMLDAEADGDEAGDAAFAAYMARERHEADAKLKSLQEAWRKESNAKDRSTNRRVAELKAENDRLRGLYGGSKEVKELPTDKGLAKVKEARAELERLRALHG